MLEGRNDGCRGDVSVALRALKLTMVRTFLCMVVAIPAAADPQTDREDSVVGVEARVGHGVSVGGGVGGSVWGASPVTVSVLAEMAVRQQPRTAVFGGLVWEGVQRASVGGTGGVRLRPFANGLRLSAAAIALLAPNTAYGVTTGVGYCWGRGIKICGDLEGAMFPWGSDIPKDRVAGQIQMVLGVFFDAA